MTNSKGGEREFRLTKSGVRKNVWLHRDEAEALRDAAYKERRPESEIIREALRRYLDIED